MLASRVVGLAERDRVVGVPHPVPGWDTWRGRVAAGELDHDPLEAGVRTGADVDADQGGEPAGEVRLHALAPADRSTRRLRGAGRRRRGHGRRAGRRAGRGAGRGKRRRRRRGDRRRGDRRRGDRCRGDRCRGDRCRGDGGRRVRRCRGDRTRRGHGVATVRAGRDRQRCHRHRCDQRSETESGAQRTGTDHGGHALMVRQCCGGANGPRSRSEVPIRDPDPPLRRTATISP
jgi:hypothetical protein